MTHQNNSNAPRFLTLVLFAALLAGCVAPSPAPVRDTTPPSSQRGAVAAQPSATGQPVHVVRPGDTLLGIARNYGVQTKDLIAWNQLADPNQIHVGQEIRVGPPAGTTVQPIAISQPIEMEPGTESAKATVKQEPRGGKQPYSDEAWAAIQPKAPAAPAPSQPSPAPAATNGATTSDPVWLWPANGQIIGTFDEASNKGLDIAGKPGDSVIASAGGKVVYSGSGLRGYGKLVIIKHDANYLTAYAHNQQLLVKEGESVAKGQKIAELGSTDADRPKLHFEIRKQGRPVDPMKYLPAR